MPNDEVPNDQFQPIAFPHSSRPDTTGDSRRYLKDMLVDERRDESTLRYVGNRQSKVVGRLSQL